MKIEELQGSLEAHELKMVNKNVEKVIDEQALQAQVSNRCHSSRGRWKKNSFCGKLNKRRMINQSRSRNG